MISDDWVPSTLSQEELQSLDLDKLRALDPQEMSKVDIQTRRELWSRDLYLDLEDKFMEEQGRPPTLSETLSMVYKSETGPFRHADGGAGKEAFARHFFEIIGEEGELSEQEFFKFLGTQHAWYARQGHVDSLSGSGSSHYSNYQEDVGDMLGDPGEAWRHGIGDGNQPYTWGNVYPGDRHYNQLVAMANNPQAQGKDSDEVVFARHLQGTTADGREYDYVYFIVTYNQPWRIG